MINYANKKDILTSIITNGLLLNEENVVKLLESGIDHIKISLQGANLAEYETMRKKGVYETIIKNVKNLVDHRNKNNFKDFHSSKYFCYQ
jgi:MoaA/NifB/PqqE/SkfB family radical SAM enzyme